MKNFTEQMKRLSNYFGVSINEDQVKAYYQQLYNIPKDALDRIVSKMISSSKPLKSHFPTISQFWPLYEAECPSKKYEQVEFEGTECPECNGEGLIFYKYWSFKNSGVYTSHAACALCQNWKKHYNTLEPHDIRTGDGKFLYKFHGIEQTTKEHLCLKNGVLEVPEDGTFKLTKKQLNDRVMQFYGVK